MANARRVGPWKDERGFCRHGQTDFMVVVAIIGILAAIAIPKFEGLLRLSREAGCKGKLGIVRSALKLHYEEHERAYPADLEALVHGGRYLAQLPTAKTPNHHLDSATVRPVRSAAELDDRGGWAYAGDRDSEAWGSIWVNCTHTDSKGRSWSGY